MKHQHPTAAPAAAPGDLVPTYEDLLADPEIASLLDFVPVVRRSVKAGGWNAEMQRMFIAWLAHYGSPGKAATELGKARSGIDKVFTSEGAETFRASWDAAIALAERRRIARVRARNAGAGGLRIPTMSRLRAGMAGTDAHDADRAPAANMVRNEYGEWEDEASFQRRGEEARDSISTKLLRCRRLYLQEICTDPAKRAAFEILTVLPIDWARAERLEAQDDEPWKVPNMRTPEMLLTAENGWMGNIVHGPDKTAELRQALDAYRAEQGLEPIDWASSSEEDFR